MSHKVKSQKSKACPVSSLHQNLVGDWCGVKSQKEKGVSLYLTVVIMSVLLAISLGLSSILIVQIKVIKGMEDSVVAFFAADTGIENELKINSNPGTSYSGFLDLDNNGQTGTNCPEDLVSYRGDCCYEVQILDQGEDGCQALNRCIRSIGVFKETRRALEVLK